MSLVLKIKGFLSVVPIKLKVVSVLPFPVRYQGVCACIPTKSVQKKNKNDFFHRLKNLG